MVSIIDIRKTVFIDRYDYNTYQFHGVSRDFYTIDGRAYKVKDRSSYITSVDIDDADELLMHVAESTAGWDDTSDNLIEPPDKLPLVAFYLEWLFGYVPGEDNRARDEEPYNDGVDLISVRVVSDYRDIARGADSNCGELIFLTALSHKLTGLGWLSNALEILDIVWKTKTHDIYLRERCTALERLDAW